MLAALLVADGIVPPQRSTSDPDLFLLYEQYADEAAFERHAHVARLDALRRLVAK